MVTKIMANITALAVTKADRACESSLETAKALHEAIWAKAVQAKAKPPRGGGSAGHRVDRHFYKKYKVRTYS